MYCILEALILPKRRAVKRLSSTDSSDYVKFVDSGAESASEAESSEKASASVVNSENEDKSDAESVQILSSDEDEDEIASSDLEDNSVSGSSPSDVEESEVDEEDDNAGEDAENQRNRFVVVTTVYKSLLVVYFACSSEAKMENICENADAFLVLCY